MIVVTIVAHWPNGFWAAKNGWEFPILLLAGSLAITLIGFGSWSLDAALNLTYPDWLTPGWLAPEHPRRGGAAGDPFDPSGAGQRRSRVTRL